MIDPAASVPVLPLGAGEALAVAGVALVLVLAGGRFAETAARRVGFGPVLSGTVLAAAGWIALFGFGILAPPAALTDAGFMLPAGLIAVSGMFLTAIFAAEGRLQQEEVRNEISLTDWQGQHARLDVSAKSGRPCTTNSSTTPD